MTDELSTSAQLRQTQQDLAASQADLTRMEAERHAAVDRVADVLEEMRAIQQQRDLARAELAAATAELEQLRGGTDG